MKATYKHTNVVSSDWQSLSRFYQEVFGCTPVPQVRNLSGDWLEKGTGITGAMIEGMHFRLPGYGVSGRPLKLYIIRKIVKNQLLLPTGRDLATLLLKSKTFRQPCLKC
jgi:hypothetical protein